LERGFLFPTNLRRVAKFRQNVFRYETFYTGTSSAKELVINDIKVFGKKLDKNIIRLVANLLQHAMTFWLPEYTVLQTRTIMVSICVTENDHYVLRGFVFAFSMFVAIASQHLSCSAAGSTQISIVCRS